MFELYGIMGLCLLHKYMPSKHCNSMKMESLILKQWGLVNEGTFDVIPNYNRVGFDLNNSGGQGGEFNEPWEAQEECLKRYVGFWFIHLVFDGGGEGGLTLLVRSVLLMLRNQQDFTLS